MSIKEEVFQLAKITHEAAADSGRLSMSLKLQY